MRQIMRSAFVAGVVIGATISGTIPERAGAQPVPGHFTPVPVDIDGWNPPVPQGAVMDPGPAWAEVLAGAWGSNEDPSSRVMVSHPGDEIDDSTWLMRLHKVGSEDVLDTAVFSLISEHDVGWMSDKLTDAMRASTRPGHATASVRAGKLVGAAGTAYIVTLDFVLVDEGGRGAGMMTSTLLATGADASEAQSKAGSAAGFLNGTGGAGTASGGSGTPGGGGMTQAQCVARAKRMYDNCMNAVDNVRLACLAAAWAASELVILGCWTAGVAGPIGIAICIAAALAVLATGIAVCETNARSGAVNCTNDYIRDMAACGVQIAYY